VSSAFIKTGNAQWRAKTGRDLIPSTESLLRAPIVIAMWQPMAETIGGGRQPVGWAEIHGLITDPQGWATSGQPAWGKFLFGRTNPQSSSSGLHSLFAEAYAAAGKTSELTVADVERPEVARFVNDIEAAALHTENSTGCLAEKMFANGVSYTHAAVLYESMVVASYTQKQPPSIPVVAIYAKEGTFVSDHPVGIVDAEWVTEEHRDAARTYLDFLLAREQQEKALAFGFRPARADVPLVAPLDAAHGVNPKEPQTTLEVPSVEVMDAMMKLWEKSTKR
jgi:Ca-activated chloride channel family protein